MPWVWLSLGSNIDRETNIRAAVRALVVDLPLDELGATILVIHHTRKDDRPLRSKGYSFYLGLLLKLE